MKRFFIPFFILFVITGLAVGLAQAQTQKGAFPYEDPIGVVKIRPGNPIHIACWMVVAGPDASLGTDTKRGVEIAIEDKGRKTSRPSHQADGSGYGL